MSLEPPREGWGPLLDRALGPSPPVRDALSRYLDEVVAWNRKTDLTAARSAEELVDLTVADAAVVAKASTEPGRWIDVGSGAGAPGLVLALLLEPVQMTLVEPRERRVAFLRSTIGKLALRRTTVERGRSDRLAGGGWDVAISRATLPPTLWLEEGARLARRAIWVLLAREEAPTQPGLRVDVDVRYEWPLTHAPRRAVRYVVEDVDGPGPVGEM